MTLPFRGCGAMPGFNRLLAFQVLAFLLILVLFYRQSVISERLLQYAAAATGESKEGDAKDASSVVHGRGNYGYGAEDLVVFYNRVPKTGSTTLMAVVYDLTKVNRFTCIHLNTTKNSHVMSLADQMRFTRNITQWKDRLPAVFHGHVYYIDFQRFGHRRPILIQLIREPLDRLISHYYFLRYGDNYRPHLIRTKMGDKQTFDECVRKKNHGCKPADLWVQIPFFCGMSPRCRVVGSRWALAEAKHNLLANYLVVGVTEQIPQFVAVLEATIPRIFQGASRQYLKGGKTHLRKTKKKILPNDETLSLLKSSQEYKMEHDFYDFVMETFEGIKQQTIYEKNGIFLPRPSRFHYEKAFGPDGKFHI